MEVNLDVGDGPVPDTLYQGTAPENRPSIRAAGLTPMTPQHVHLSGTVADARAVGRPNADEPVILGVDAAEMAADGHVITKRGRETYTTDRVQPAYIDRLDDE